MINKLSVLLSFFVIPSALAVTVLSEANFDGINTLNAGNNGATLTTSSGDAPAGSNGEVGIIDIGGANIWGAINPPVSNNPLPLPSGVVPGVDTFTASFRYYIPSTTTFSGTDRVNLIVRRNNGNYAGNSWGVNKVWDSVEFDTWHTITNTQVIPEFEADGTTPVTGLAPILSFYDRKDTDNAEGGVGIAAYIDDWSFSVTQSAVPEPSSSVALLLGLGMLGMRRKR